MKIKDGFVIRDVANQAMVIAIGKASESFKGLIKMNQTSKEIWLLIKEGFDIDEIVKRMCSKYNATEEIIRKDVLYIVDVLKKNNILEDE